MDYMLGVSPATRCASDSAIRKLYLTIFGSSVLPAISIEAPGSSGIMGAPQAKRPINQVDLTLDEIREVAPAPPPKYPRVSGQRFGQDTTFIPLNHAPQVSLEESGDDSEATGLIQGSQVVDDSSDSTQWHYGDLHTKIVGVRYYRGQATIGEHVVLKREPHNQYDRNAIRVDNVMGAQVGHIPRNMAAKLASYLVGLPLEN